MEKPTPVVRRRSKSVTGVDLEVLLHELSGPERERVRGYIDAILEQRADPKVGLLGETAERTDRL